MSFRENRRVLIVDDNDAIHSDFRKIIAADGGLESAVVSAAAALFDERARPQANANFDVDSAFQGQEGLARVQQSIRNNLPYAVAFIDVRMPPGWDGIETVQKIWQVDRDVQVALCTAYSDYSWNEMIEVLGETDRLLILKKPFDTIEVRQITSALVAKWNLAKQANRTLEDHKKMVRDRTAELDASNQQLRREVVERKRSEQALRESEARSRAILDTAADGIVTIDDFGVIESVNQMTDRMFGYAHRELIGKNIRTLMPSPYREQHDEYLARFRRTGKSNIIGTRRPFAGVRSDGRIFPIEISVSELRLADRSLFTGIIRDTTEQKLLEAQLIQSQKLESVGQLAAGIAHEINTPTQYVGYNAQFLQDAFRDVTRLLDQFDHLLAAAKRDEISQNDIREVEEAIQAADLPYLMEEIPKAISQSLDGVGRMTAIVQAIREFSHPSGKAKTLIDLNQAIESTAMVARNEWTKVADLVTDFDSALPPVPCWATELNQAILNLIVNAAHAIDEAQQAGSTARGRITLRTRHLGEWIEIQVCDTGTGIAPGNYSKIFDPFFTTKQVGKGTGQGLAIARTIVVKKHQGTITFESAQGQGTTFTIRLPLKPENESAELAPSLGSG
ncbi:MAG: PAS domain S-box protein [Planctomycetia bacterium]|nr:PAS domain S-box protein [Planctomycetia bacterium]